MFRRTCVLIASLAALLVAPVAASAEPSVVGDPGGGDPFFPLAGNGGYDVRHYSLDLSYVPTPVNRLTGRVAIFARATQDLSRFNVDLRDFLTVSRVTVNFRRASFTHSGQELSITPRTKLRRGSPFVVIVEYSGEPEPVKDPDEAIEGWVPTDDGAMVVNEPQGAPGWFPVNDTPLDKATYDFAITVPAGSTAIANGVLVGRQSRRDTTTWRWLVTSPMASYLATATNGPFETRFRRLPGGLPEYNAVDPDSREGYDVEDPPNPALAWERLEPQPEIVRFFSSLYGTYPFESIGSIIDWAPDVGYALESQTRINYDTIPDLATVVHEIAHQWFGNAVTLATWPDIWLNEGFATWSEWIYDEKHGGPPAQERFDELYAITEADDAASKDCAKLWTPAPAALPDASFLFCTPVYNRGGMTLQALRQKIGDAAFIRILRTWYRDHRNGNASTIEFIALAERESHRQLDDFFRVWLYEEGRPDAW